MAWTLGTSGFDDVTVDLHGHTAQVPRPPLHAIDGQGKSACGLVGLVAADGQREWASRGSFSICSKCEALVPDRAV